ncbi:MAG: helix-turn-helix transcriptional regulator [Kocuria palustris]|nr:helix-turn-helix transcriptional regulator [Kocuria palustris]
MAERAGLSHTAVNDVVHGDAKNPAHETLAGIARALELPLADVYALSGQQRPNAEQWAPPAEANLLTARQRRAIEDLIRSIVLTSAEERGGHGEAAPMNTAGGDPAGNQQDHETPTASAAPKVGEQVPVEGGEQPSAEFFYGLAADDRPTEGMAQRDAIDAAGEESQVSADEADGA